MFVLQVKEQEGVKPPSVVTPVAVSAPEPAPARSPVPAPRSSGTGTGSTGDGAAGKSHPARARAVRLLREAVTAGRSVAGAREGGSSEAQAASSAGEVAFAVERAAMESFGAGHPRYFECVSRLASRFKVSGVFSWHLFTSQSGSQRCFLRVPQGGAPAERILADLVDGGISKCIELISPV